MKKAATVLLIVAMLALPSCAPSEKVFSVGKMSITLTSDFEPMDGLGWFDAIYYSNPDKLTLYIVKEYPEDMAERGIDNFDKYVSDAHEDFGKDGGEIRYDDGFAYFSFEDDAESKKAVDTVCMYEFGGTYYMIIFDCEALGAKSLEDDILKYARSVKFG